jgi:hypothetical protein
MHLQTENMHLIIKLSNMKIRKINILLAASFGLIAFAGCTKNDGPVTKEIGIEAVPTMSSNIDPTGSQAINMLNLPSFQGKFKVANSFEGTPNPTKVDIVVRKNGANSSVKVFKADVSTFPATFTVTAAEIATLFGAAIVLNDTYDFAPDIYVGSKKYEAFPVIAGATSGTGTGHNNIPGYSEFARFGAICAYDANIYKGNFVVVSDAFGDFSPGEVVVLTQVSANSFSFITPYVTSPLPIIVTINTLNNQATITKQKIGNAFTWNLAYTNPNAAVTAGTASFVAPCSQTLDLAIAYSVDQGSFAGTYLLKLKKQ